MFPALCGYPLMHYSTFSLFLYEWHDLIIMNDLWVCCFLYKWLALFLICQTVFLVHSFLPKLCVEHWATLWNFLDLFRSRWLTKRSRFMARQVQLVPLTAVSEHLHRSADIRHVPSLVLLDCCKNMISVTPQFL